MTFTLRAGIKEWVESQKVSAQTNAVLKSTGQVAGITKKHVDDLADSMLRKTGIDDEAIRSSENLLLGFTHIRNEMGKGNDVFDRTTKLVQDYAVRTGKSATLASMAFGKALNDPIKGMGALGRAGVILTRRRRRRSRASSTPASRSRRRPICSISSRRASAARPRPTGNTAGPTLDCPRELQELRRRLDHASDPVYQACDRLGRAALARNLENDQRVLAGGEADPCRYRRPDRRGGRPDPKALGNHRADRAGCSGGREGQFQILAGIIKFFAAILRGDWSGAWNALKGIVRGVFNEITAFLRAILDTYGKIGGGIARALISGFTGAISGGWKAVKKAVTDLFGQVVGWVKGIFGIKSPSTVFHGLGQQLIRGFVNGVGSMGGVLKKAVLGIAGSALHAAGSFFSSGKNTLSGLSNRVRGAVAFAQSHGWQGQVTSGYRTYAQQARLYQRYLNGGPLAAAPGTSSHETGQAVDVTNPSAFARAMSMMPIWARLYNRLGAADPVHFSVSGYDKGGWLPTGLSLAMNNTGRPERVGGDIVVPVSIGGEHIATVVFDMLRRKAQVFENRNRRPAW